MRKCRKSGSIPRLNRAQERFDRWRGGRKHRRERIPEKLWRLAAKLAGTYGINRTARALGLRHDRLKEHTGAAGALPAARFVELPGVALSRGGSVIEVERPGGAKLRIELGGGEVLDVAALARGFVEARG